MDFDVLLRDIYQLLMPPAAFLKIPIGLLSTFGALFMPFDEQERYIWGLWTAPDDLLIAIGALLMLLY